MKTNMRMTAKVVLALFVWQMVLPADIRAQTPPQAAAPGKLATAVPLDNEPDFLWNRYGVHPLVAQNDPRLKRCYPDYKGEVDLLLIQNIILGQQGCEELTAIIKDAFTVNFFPGAKEMNPMFWDELVRLTAAGAWAKQTYPKGHRFPFGMIFGTTVVKDGGSPKTIVRRTGPTVINFDQPPVVGFYLTRGINIPSGAYAGLGVTPVWPTECLNVTGEFALAEEVEVAAPTPTPLTEAISRVTETPQQVPPTKPAEDKKSKRGLVWGLLAAGIAAGIAAACLGGGTEKVLQEAGKGTTNPGSSPP